MARKGKNRKRKSKHSFASAVLEVFQQNPFKGYNFRQLSAALGITDKASKQLVKEILSDLEQAGEIVAEKRGKYKLNPENIKPEVQSGVVTGIVDMKQTGKAYVISDELPEDVFIAPNNTGRALNGDRVKVHLFPKRKGRKLEGRIIGIEHRAKTQIAGVFEKSGKFGFVIPDDPSIPVDLFIPAEKQKRAQHGEKVIALLTDWPEHSRNPFGEITEVLGKPGEHEVEMRAILADAGFPSGFPDQAEREAAKIPDEISQDEIARRRDFRQVFTCTVDPEDAKDFDDALSLRRTEEGLWEVGVHIADVTHYVREGTFLDQEAFRRATSVYLVDRVIPMLPERLSNHVCSLRPDEDKLCYSAVFQLDDDAKVVNEWFGRTIIRSDFRYNYEQVYEIIQGASDPYREQIMILHQLASKLRKRRFEKGAIAFTSQEVKFRLDENGKPVEAYIREQNDAHRLIEDFMLLANRKVAEKIGKRRGKQKERTFVYRIHDVPNPEKLQQFAEFVSKLGYKIQTHNRKAISGSMNRLFEQIKGKGEENMIENIAVRTMSKAEYSVQNIGHYGLAFAYYTHFTSPIRRYPDMMVHRLLDHYLNGGASVSPVEYEEKCKHASEMERKALEAERASVKYKQAEFLLDKVGQTFDGLISGVSKWGIYVELNGNKCEGMISLRLLDDDFYYLDENNYTVIGAQTGRTYRLGDPITIRVRRIDLIKKQMDFEPA
ncbi:MAG: ribonuclease R [Bacteroidales bacterium]